MHHYMNVIRYELLKNINAISEQKKINISHTVLFNIDEEIDLTTDNELIIRSNNRFVVVLFISPKLSLSTIEHKSSREEKKTLFV